MEDVLIHASVELLDGSWSHLRFVSSDEATAKITLWNDDGGSYTMELRAEAADSLITALELARANQKRSSFVKYLRGALDAKHAELDTQDAVTAQDTKPEGHVP